MLEKSGKKKTTRYKLPGNLSTLLAKKYLYIFILFRFFCDTFFVEHLSLGHFLFGLTLFIFSLELYILNSFLFTFLFGVLFPQNIYSHCHTHTAVVCGGGGGGGDGVCILDKICLFRSIVNSSIVNSHCCSHCVRKSYDTAIIV